MTAAGGSARLCEMYDDRPVAVNVSFDDFRDDLSDDFFAQADLAHSNGLYVTFGINAGLGVTTGDVAGLNERITNGWLEVANHSYLHTMAATYTTSDIPEIAEEVTLNDNWMHSNLLAASWSQYSGTNYFPTWIQPGSGYGRTNEVWNDTINSNLAARNYLLDRRANHSGIGWGAWSTNKGYYGAVSNVWSGSDYDYFSDHFDDVTSTGGIWLAYNHPESVYADSATEAVWGRVFKLVGGRLHTWYAPLGALYMYHYAQDRAGVVLDLDESARNASIITVSVPESERSKYGLSYPLTVEYTFPSNWPSVQDVAVEWVGGGETNQLTRRHKWQSWNGVEGVRVAPGKAYISAAFPPSGTNMTMTVTPVGHGL